MMQHHWPGEIANRILLALPESSLDRLKPHLHAQSTTRGQIIDTDNSRVEHIYFVNRGLVSLVKTMRDGRTVEIEAIGIEGVTDPNTLFGVEEAIVETLVQIPGTAFRIRRDVLQNMMNEDDVLRTALQNYARFAIRQIVQTAACNRLRVFKTYR